MTPGALLWQKRPLLIERINAILRLATTDTPTTERCRQHGHADRCSHRRSTVFGDREPSATHALTPLHKKSIRPTR
jgi:hypothetical protein